jgi:FtsP/CotA-like multicopper oxidase with cupredoxin domain
VRIYVTNKLPEGTSIHWHGFILPNGMDGVTGLTQPKIAPGETFAYEFTLKQNGTLMYHPHFDEMVQINLGMHGFFIVHPRDASVRRVDRDFAIFLNEWFIKPGTATPDPTVMLDFNVFTFNSRVFPGTDPMLVRLGDRVRIRLANLTMDSHPMHIHGHRFFVTGTDAGAIPQSAWFPENTANVPVGTTRDIEFVADNPGDWHFHCHLPHHMMNQMVSMVGPLMMSHANTPRPGVADPPNAGMYPGYPQDMSMVMDEMVAKPETHGLRAGWSAGTMGMMTIVRVLEPDLFDKIQALKAEEAKKAGAR